MPDMETQTEDFIILSKEQIKALSIPERKQYKAEYKQYKHECSLEKTKIYMRNYMRTYQAMKYKYDPVYREKAIASMYRTQEKKREKRRINKLLNQGISIDEINKMKNNEINKSINDKLVNELGLLTI